MTIQAQLAEVKALIEAMTLDYDESVDVTGAALAEISTCLADAQAHIAAKWKRAHRIRSAEQNAVEPPAEG